MSQDHLKEISIAIKAATEAGKYLSKNKNELNLVAHIITIEPRSKEIKSMP